MPRAERGPSVASTGPLPVPLQHRDGGSTRAPSPVWRAPPRWDGMPSRPACGSTRGTDRLRAALPGRCHPTAAVGSGATALSLRGGVRAPPLVAAWVRGSQVFATVAAAAWCTWRRTCAAGAPTGRASVVGDGAGLPPSRAWTRFWISAVGKRRDSLKQTGGRRIGWNPPDMCLV